VGGRVRKDPITGPRVIISTERGKRPQRFPRKSVNFAKEKRKKLPFVGRPANERGTASGKALFIYGWRGTRVRSQHARMGAFGVFRQISQR